jgi:hypothetical protein
MPWIVFPPAAVAASLDEMQRLESKRTNARIWKEFWAVLLSVIALSIWIAYLL